jgi:hypothetical protein
VTRDHIIFGALLVGLLDLVVLRLRGGLKVYRRVDLRKYSQDVWRVGGEVIATGVDLAPHVFVGIVRARRRTRLVRMRHKGKG